MDFSIIIPAKNEAANIARCLDSIRKMECDRVLYEVIVVDNGSTDATADIAREMGANVYVKPELTVAGLRNFGAAHAAGKVMAFIDADCTVATSWLVNAATYLHRRDVVCYGSPPNVPDDATWLQKTWFAVRKKKSDRCATDWLESMNMFVQREAFIAVGGFDESLLTCEDYDLSLRLKQQGVIITDSSIVALHHGEAATVGQFFRKELWRGKSNFAGVMRHGLTFQEIPSLLAPPLHCLLWFCWLAVFLVGSSAAITVMTSCLLIWQILLCIVAFKKLPTRSRIVFLCQLVFLLNIYFFARGAAVFASGRRTGTLPCAV